MRLIDHQMHIFKCSVAVNLFIGDLSLGPDSDAHHIHQCQFQSHDRKNSRKPSIQIPDGRTTENSMLSVKLVWKSFEFSHCYFQCPSYGQCCFLFLLVAASNNAKNRPQSVFSERECIPQESLESMDMSCQSKYLVPCTNQMNFLNQNASRWPTQYNRKRIANEIKRNGRIQIRTSVEAVCGVE